MVTFIKLRAWRPCLLFNPIPTTPASYPTSLIGLQGRSSWCLRREDGSPPRGWRWLRRGSCKWGLTGSAMEDSIWGLPAQRSLLDVLNVVFLLGYSLSLLVTSLTKRGTSGSRTGDQVFWVSSVLCAGTGFAHISAGLWSAYRRSHGIPQWSPWLYLVRGLVWIAVAASLCIQRTKWKRALVITWWVSHSALLSALNIMILVEEHTLQILDVAAWLASLLLLSCALRLIRRPPHQHHTSSHSLSEPLLNGQEEERKTELTRAGLFSRLTFSWLNPLLHLGNSKPLLLDDIACVDAEDDALIAYQVFSHEWDLLRRDASRTRDLVLFSLARCYWKEMTVVGVYALLKTAALVVSPLLLFAFVEYAGRREEDLRTGFLLLVFLVVLKAVESLSQRHWFFDARRFGMRMRSALMAAVFRKQLKLSSLGRRNHSTGEVVNYIAVDAYRLGEFPWWFHMAWTLTLQLDKDIDNLLCTIRFKFNWIDTDMNFLFLSFFLLWQFRSRSSAPSPMFPKHHGFKVGRFVIMYYMGK